jgi:hypothetical protein
MISEARQSCVVGRLMMNWKGLERKPSKPYRGAIPPGVTEEKYEQSQSG